MKKARLAGLMAMTFLVISLPGAQNSESSPPDDPIRVEVETVNVLVSVHDSDTGQFVMDLKDHDFQVLEDGVRQKIVFFSRQTNLPLNLAMCVDTSASVKLKLDFEKEVASDFLYSVMRPSDRALLAEFDTGVTLLHDFTSNPNDLAAEIRSLRAGGGTSLYDAIYLISAQKMLRRKGRKAIVILSDGADLTSKRTFRDAMQMAHKAEVTIYAISTTRFGADIDHEGDNALRQLTENTGGRAFFPYSSKHLVSAFEAIDQELRSQYNLAYVPINKGKDGKFRSIKVKVNRDNVKLRHRKGYFAPDGAARLPRARDASPAPSSGRAEVLGEEAPG